MSMYCGLTSPRHTGELFPFAPAGGVGNEMAETIVKAAAELRDQRPEVQALYARRQLARLGDKADGLVADAAKALRGRSSRSAGGHAQVGRARQRRHDRPARRTAQARAMRGSRF